MSNYTNTTSKMKKVGLISVLFFGFIFSSCEKANIQAKATNSNLGVFTKKLKLVEIDSCEYLWGDMGYARVLTHKGNCKYCAKRLKKAKTTMEYPFKRPYKVEKINEHWVNLVSEKDTVKLYLQNTFTFYEKVVFIDYK